MERDHHLSDYLALLTIRQRTYRRNLIIAAGLILVAFLSTTGTLLLTEWNVRSVWMMGMFDFLFLVNFLMAWARLEITKENIALVKHLSMQG